MATGNDVTEGRPSLDQFDFLQELNRERVDILAKRNKQYSDREGGFIDNFRDVAAIANVLEINVNARQVAIILAILKMVRNENGVRAGHDVNFRRDHIVDASNYIDLAHLCEKFESEGWM